MGFGVAQLLITYLMSLYVTVIEGKPTAPTTFESVFHFTYNCMLFVSLVGISAVILASWKVFSLLVIHKKPKKKEKKRKK